MLFPHQVERSSSIRPCFEALPVVFPSARFSLSSTIRRASELDWLDLVRWNRWELGRYSWNISCVVGLKNWSFFFNNYMKFIYAKHWMFIKTEISVPFICVINIWTNMPFGASWCKTQRMNWCATDCEQPGKWVGFSYCHGNFTWLANLK